MAPAKDAAQVNSNSQRPWLLAVRRTFEQCVIPGSHATHGICTRQKMSYCNSGTGGGGGYISGGGSGTFYGNGVGGHAYGGGAGNGGFRAGTATGSFTYGFCTSGGSFGGGGGGTGTHFSDGLGPRPPDPSLRARAPGVPESPGKYDVRDGMADRKWRRTFPWTATLRATNLRVFGNKSFRWGFTVMYNTPTYYDCTLNLNLCKRHP